MIGKGKTCGGSCGTTCCQDAIWMDNNAVMPPLTDVRRKVAEVMNGGDCRRSMENVRDTVRTTLGMDGEVVFTSGGTENAFLISAGVRYPERQKIVTSILDPLCMLMQPDIEIMGIDDHAYVEAEKLRQYLMDNADVAAVHLTMVNGEYGIITPVGALAKLVKMIDKDVFVYVDASQACTRMRLDDIPEEIDAVGISGAKIGGLPGAGALWIRDPDRLDSLMPGVRRQQGIRGGSMNEVGVMAMGIALGRSLQRVDMDFEQMSDMRSRLDEMLLNIGGISLNFEDKAMVCNTSNYKIQDVDTRRLCMVLRKQGLRVSESCSTISMTTMQSPLTTFLNEEPFRNLRFSLSIHNTTKDIEAAYLKVKASVEMFRSHNLGN